MLFQYHIFFQRISDRCRIKQPVVIIKFVIEGMKASSMYRLFSSGRFGSLSSIRHGGPARSKSPRSGCRRRTMSEPFRLAQILPRSEKTSVRKNKIGEISGGADGEIGC